MNKPESPTSLAGGAPLDRGVRAHAAENARHWRLLNNTDTIRRGDEYLNEDCETWLVVETILLGEPYSRSSFVSIRRAMNDCAKHDVCRICGCQNTCTPPQ